MVKFFSATHTFSHPFDAVSSAFLRKYPNSRAPHVKSVDTVERSINSDGHLVIKRVIGCEQNLPTFLTALGLGSRAFMCETTTIDPRQKTMTIQTRNLTMPGVCLIEELCKYRADEDRTVYEQSAAISASIPLLNGQIESYCLQTQNRRSVEGIQSMDELIERVRLGGISSLLPLHMVDGLKLNLEKLKQLHRDMPSCNLDTLKDSLSLPDSLKNIDINLADTLPCLSSLRDSISASFKNIDMADLNFDKLKDSIPASFKQLQMDISEKLEAKFKRTPSLPPPSSSSYSSDSASSSP